MIVPGLDEYGFGFVLKTSLSRGGAFMEEQIFLFPLPVEKLHTEFDEWLSLLLVLDVALG